VIIKAGKSGAALIWAVPIGDPSAFFDLSDVFSFVGLNHVFVPIQSDETLLT
jgi:hypothetical protein